MREQESSDTWAIHQLYNASVPRDVLYAEALTSHAWDIANSRRPGVATDHGLAHRGRCRGWALMCG